MKTPYDAALRVQQREIDAIRVAIGVAAVRHAEVAGARVKLDVVLATEARVAAGDWAVGAHAYARRMRGTRARLDSDQRAIESELDRLRSTAMRAYAPLRAIEGAAQRFGTAALHSEAMVEQAHADDFSGARIAGRARAEHAAGRPPPGLTR